MTQGIQSIARVARVKLAVSAEIEYTDLSLAIWEREDRRYFGAELAVTDSQDSVVAKIFVELARERDEISVSSAQFLTRDLTVTDSFSDG